MTTLIAPSAPTRSAFVAAARSYLGVPYRHQGRNRVGMDCVGLVVCAARDVGYDVPDMIGYRRAGDGIAFMRHVRANGREIVGDAPLKRGQIIAFQQQSFPAHLGIFDITPQGQHVVIHSYASRRKVEEQSFDTWRLLMIARFDLPGIREG